MLTGLSINTTATWIIAALTCASVTALFLTLYSWRDASKAAYYFQKRESYQRMQSYSLITIALFVLVFVIGAYAITPQTVQEPIIKVLTNAKPQQDFVDESPVQQAARSGSVIENRGQITQLNPLAVRAVAIEPKLPARFQKLDSEADMVKDTAISNLIFSTEIDDTYAPMKKGSEFSAGSFNLYATFDYAQMKDGINWAWVWKHNGDIVGGGEQVWAYGNTGPGYVYFNPQSGFDVGEYTLEIWLNGELVNQNSLDVVASVAR